jgi:ankyrin repeat protein
MVPLSSSLLAFVLMVCCHALLYLWCVTPCYRYKVCRAANPTALHRDFEVNRRRTIYSLRSFDSMQKHALERMRLFLMSASDFSHQFKDLEGATQLWKAAELGCHMAVEEALQHPNIDPNKTHKETGTTPLYIAAYFGHERVVKALLRHPSIQVNRGKDETTPLFMAAQEGREEIVKMLLSCKDVDIEKASAEGITPACVASEFGHDYIYGLLSKNQSAREPGLVSEAHTTYVPPRRSSRILRLEL